MSQNYNRQSKLFDLKEQEDRVAKLVSSKYSASFMSNTKWEKLFKALDTNDLLIKYILLKRVNRKEPYISYMPKVDDLEGIWVSEGKGECNYFYKEIEWIELIHVHKPSNIPSQCIYQSTEVAFNVINNIGKFEIELNHSGLRIYGYKT